MRSPVGKAGPANISHPACIVAPMWR